MIKINYLILMILGIIAFSYISVEKKENNTLTRQEVKDG